MRSELAILLGALLALTACKDDSNTSDGTGGNASGVGGSAGEGGLGGMGGAGASGGSGGEGGSGGSGGQGGAVPLRQGFVGGVSAGPPLMVQSSALAAFVEGQVSVCTPTTTIGNCEVQLCDQNPTFSPETDAGTITLSGGERTATLTWDGTDYPKEESESEALFLDGQSITFASSGSADVPAFNETLIAPGQAQLLTPALITPFVIDRSLDMPLSWSGGNVGTFQVQLNGLASLNAPTSVRLDCRFPVTGGSGTIPSAALSELPATSYAGIVMRVLQDSSITAGDWDLSLNLLTPVTSADTSEGYALLVQDVSIQ